MAKMYFLNVLEMIFYWVLNLCSNVLSKNSLEHFCVILKMFQSNISKKRFNNDLKKIGFQDDYHII